MLEPYITKQDTHWRRAIPSRTRLFSYLLYVTQGFTYNHISMLLSIGVMSACKCIHECTRALCLHMYSARIRLPTLVEARVNMEKWRQQTGLPGIYGAIDRPGIKPSKPSRPSARARLGGLHARFGLLGGVTLSLGLGSVRLSSPIGCSGSARPNRTGQPGRLGPADFRPGWELPRIPGFWLATDDRPRDMPEGPGRQPLTSP